MATVQPNTQAQTSQQDLLAHKFDALLKSVKANRPSDDLDIIRRAWAFCVEHHEGQLRASGEPFVLHPLEVALVLADMKLDATAIADFPSPFPTIWSACRAVGLDPTIGAANPASTAVSTASSATPPALAPSLVTRARIGPRVRRLRAASPMAATTSAPAAVDSAGPRLSSRARSGLPRARSMSAMTAR